ncbi:hypothetical protein [Brachybacterium hainanense]|uniref:Major facilitator superfamily (MFS) profile domain-containing protein n=1 Tax=Brachybacterium hainanense TaxID=1541174 RepID=A0ABV6RE49_9MICO
MSPPEPLPPIDAARRGDPMPGAAPRLGLVALLLALLAVLIALVGAGGIGLVHATQGSGVRLLVAPALLGTGLGLAAIGSGAAGLLRHERPPASAWGIVLGLLAPVIAGASLILGVLAGRLVLAA